MYYLWSSDNFALWLFNIFWWMNTEMIIQTPLCLSIYLLFLFILLDASKFQFLTFYDAFYFSYFCFKFFFFLLVWWFFIKSFKWFNEIICISKHDIIFSCENQFWFKVMFHLLAGFHLFQIRLLLPFFSFLMTMFD